MVEWWLYTEHFKPPVLLLVAHWDDEVLLAGGTLKKYGRGWTVVCATNKDYMAYQENVFKEVCKSADANPITLPIYHRTERFDGSQESAIDFERRAKHKSLTAKMIVDAFKNVNIDIGKYNTIITHHPNGDLGRHIHHRQLGNIVPRLFKGKIVYHFVMPPRIVGYRSAHNYFVRKASHIEVLEDKYLVWKWEAIRKYKKDTPMILMVDEEAYFRRVRAPNKIFSTLTLNFLVPTYDLTARAYARFKGLLMK
jgi:hypothetical protein